MEKLTIDDVDFRVLAFRDFRVLAFDYKTESKNYKNLVAHIGSKLKEAYEQGKKDAATWLPIDTAPKDGSHILLLGIFTQVKVTGGYWYQKNERWIAGGYMTETEGFTHWMPLPKEPIC